MTQSAPSMQDVPWQTAPKPAHSFSSPTLTLCPIRSRDMLASTSAQSTSALCRGAPGDGHFRERPFVKLMPAMLRIVRTCAKKTGTVAKSTNARHGVAGPSSRGVFPTVRATSSARQPAAARQNTTLQRRAIISATVPPVNATCTAEQCTVLKAEQSAFCKEHTCHVRTCDKATNFGPYCEDHCCSEARCQNLRDWMPESENCGRFCPLHTCRVDQCRKHVDSLSIFCLAHGCSMPKCHQQAIAEQLCIDHFKEHYITQGKQQAFIPIRGQQPPFPPPQRPYADPGRRPARHEDAGSESSGDDEQQPPQTQPQGRVAGPAQRPVQNPPPAYTQPNPQVRGHRARPPSYSSVEGRPNMPASSPQEDSISNESAARPLRGRRPQVEDGNEDSED